MKRWILLSAFLAACHAAPATDSVEQGLDDWCGGGGAYEGKTMPTLKVYSGLLPKDPLTTDTVVIMYDSPNSLKRFWAVYIVGESVVAWQDVAKADFSAYMQKLWSSGWGTREIPRVGNNPPPPPPDGDDEIKWYAEFFLEVAALERAVTEIAEARAAY
jgi:hypothetical protein